MEPRYGGSLELELNIIKTNFHDGFLEFIFDLVRHEPPPSVRFVIDSALAASVSRASGDGRMQETVSSE